MTATTSTEICMRFALLDPISLALAFHHREIRLYLGELRSVAQCKSFFGGEGGGEGEVFVSLFSVQSDRYVLAVRDRFEAPT